MTIQDVQAYLDSLWDWKILRGCFGDTKIEPTDIDGFVERYGRYLLLETKGDGVEIKQGQMITFQSLADTGLYWIIVIWGSPGQPRKMRVITKGFDHTYEKVNMNYLIRVVSRWFKLANGCKAKKNGQ